jgi:hypothetical protein
MVRPVQRSLTECGVSECDREVSIRGGPGPLGAVAPWEKINVISKKSYCEIMNGQIVMLLPTMYEYVMDMTIKISLITHLEFTNLITSLYNSSTSFCYDNRSSENRIKYFFVSINTTPFLTSHSIGICRLHSAEIRD